MTQNRGEQALVRPHVVTEGRAHPSRNTFDALTVVIATREQLGALSPEKRRLMELCRGGALSVAEVAAHLSLPISVTKVLLSDLVDSGHIATRATVPYTTRPNEKLLKDVLDGLRARL
jgi:DNA-directed RNA polymerase specialized sigma24 family protein